MRNRGDIVDKGVCGHGAYQYQGIVWSHGNMVPGSGAHYMVYEDRYFCTVCLETKDTNRRIMGNSYEKTIPWSVPK